ncbi:MAG: tRNA lysidine(34) synthetase TilS, partial [Oscillochloris sp.]|nr:tRNA lysidine(34) synthetase TilS [Oscillochloris sp.]
ESAAEARAVAAIAAAWGIAATLAYADVPALARSSGEGGQAAARRARYAFLAQVACAEGAWAVAVAHHANDQAETVLLHMLRGAGPAGMRGMRPIVPWEEWAAEQVKSEEQQAAAIPPAALIRPLLETTRAEILAYCTEHELNPADDPSNRAEYYTRSRVRHQLLPSVAKHNPQIVTALGRTAQICADDYDFIQSALDATWPRLVHERPGIVELNLATWSELHPALHRYALRRAAARLGVTELSFPQIEAARRAVDTGQPRRLSISRQLQLEFGYNSALIVATDAQYPPEAPQLAVEYLAITAPGCTPIGAGWACLAQREPPPSPSPWWVAIPSELANTLALRRRRSGDRFRPAGGRGSRRIQDFFVDRKVPQRLRDAWPILVAGADILWVAGLRADAQAKARENRHMIWIGITRESEEEQPDDAR